MKISIASDHGGLALKQALIRHLQKKQVAVTDRGCHTIHGLDYPMYAAMVAEDVRGKRDTYGILCCGTGIGMSIAANKHHGIRAAVVTDVFSAIATKEHNDTNILCLGERVVGPGLATMIVDKWLESDFQGGRHQARISLINQIERTGGIADD